MRRLVGVFLLFAALLPPGPAAAIDCARARTAVERTVCRSPALIARDRAMTGMYDGLLGPMPRADQDRLRSIQRGWLSGLNACVVRKEAQSCLADAYDQRIQALNGGGVRDAAALPPIDAAAWRRDVESAGKLDRLVQVMSRVRETVVIPPDQAPSTDDTLAIDTSERVIASGSPAREARLVLIRVSLNHEPERPEWIWLGVFQPDGAGTARLTSATQRVAEACGYVNDHAFAQDPGKGGLSFTEMLVSACGTYVETRTRDVGCFVTDGRLTCLSGAVRELTRFDRLRPAD